jgi:hypothetical protein
VSIECHGREKIITAIVSPRAFIFADCRFTVGC